MDIEEALKINLKSYIEANRETDTSILKTRRETSIARYALEQSLLVYHTAVNFCKELIADSGSNTDLPPEERASKIMYAMKQIQDASADIIDNVKAVSAILKNSVEIEHILNHKMDGVQVYSIIAQLPGILEKAVQRAQSKEQIVLIFNQLLETELTVIDEGAPAQGVIEEDVVRMLNSVPNITTITNTTISTSSN